MKTPLHTGGFPDRIVPRRILSRNAAAMLRPMLLHFLLFSLLTGCATPPQPQNPASNTYDPSADTILSPRSTESIPATDFAAQTHEGIGTAHVPDGTPVSEAQQLAFAAAVADALADAVHPAQEALSVNHVIAETLSGTVAEYTVWRQHTAFGSLPLSDVILIKRDDFFLITVSGRLERLDPAFALPDWRDPLAMVAGMRISGIMFEPLVDGLRCRLWLLPPDQNRYVTRNEPVDGYRGGRTRLRIFPGSGHAPCGPGRRSCLRSRNGGGRRHCSTRHGRLHSHTGESGSTTAGFGCA